MNAINQNCPCCHGTGDNGNYGPCPLCNGKSEETPISVKLATIEYNNRHGKYCENQRDVDWLISTLRQKMAECEELKKELKGVER